MFKDVSIVSVSDHHRKMENIERIEANKHIIANFCLFYIFQKDQEEGSAGFTKYRKYLSFEPFPFLSSAINKVYLVGIIPVFFI